MSIIETAGDLYREIKARGLELRHGSGRDDALYRELTHRLGCDSEKSLQQFLDESLITAEEFLNHFLVIAVPFARMFQEIWTFLASTEASRAKEEIRIRFGFNHDFVDIDLQHFREYANDAIALESLSALQWPENARPTLFDMARILLDSEGDERQENWAGYLPDLQHNLPVIREQSHKCDRIATSIRSYLHSVILVVDQDPTKNHQMPRHWDLRVFLSDILPWWHLVLSEWENIAKSNKDRAVQFYEQKIEPLLATSQSDTAQRALDILRLPFWEHRWHTYEIWVTVLTLQTISFLHPIPRIRSGYLALDAQQATIIADLTAQGYTSACIATQLETPFVSGDRIAIKPDISICFDDVMNKNSRATVVEIKQRQSLPKSHLTEVGKAYKEGSPRASGVIFVNYDSDGVLSEDLEEVFLVKDLTPANQNAITAFKEALCGCLKRAGLRTIKRTLVLVDVSGSMSGQYDDESVRQDLTSLLQAQNTMAFRFADQLLSFSGVFAAEECMKVADGGTNLSLSLDQAIEKHGVFDLLIIISDGGYAHDARVHPSDTCFVCEPKDLSRAITWQVTKWRQAISGE